MKKDDSSAEIAIIGGTGIYDTTLFKEERIIAPNTPYGPTSDSIIIGKFDDKKLRFSLDMEKVINCHLI